MSRHLISDAHDWINQIPTAPIYYLPKLQPREQAWQNHWAKEADPVELDSGLTLGKKRCRMAESGNTAVKYHYSYSFFTHSIERTPASQLIFWN